MGEMCWIAFECSIYASFADDENSKSRLFKFGYRQGKSFLEALASGKIEKRDQESIPPFTLLYPGPSHDFILGQTYSAAQAQVTGYVMAETEKNAIGNSQSLMRQIATQRFNERNCRLVGK